MVWLFVISIVLQPSQWSKVKTPEVQWYYNIFYTELNNIFSQKGKAYKLNCLVYYGLKFSPSVMQLKKAPLIAGKPELRSLRFHGLRAQELAEVYHPNVVGVLSKNCVHVDVRLYVSFDRVGRQLTGGRRQSLNVPDRKRHSELRPPALSGAATCCFHLHQCS